MNFIADWLSTPENGFCVIIGTVFVLVPTVAVIAIGFVRFSTFKLQNFFEKLADKLLIWLRPKPTVKKRRYRTFLVYVFVWSKNL